MKVTYFNRDKREGNFSIESLFETIKISLTNEIEINDFNFNKRTSRIRNIINARKYQGDINHITGDINFISLGLNGDKTILTVHDLGYYENPIHSKLKKLVYEKFWFEYPLKKVAKITTVSEFTKNKIIEYFAIDAQKIIVIPNPYNEKIFIPTPKEFNIDTTKILCIGTGAHKNFERLIHSISGLNFSLIFIGKIDENLQKHLSESRISYQHFFNLSVEAVYEKYKESDILFFASLYEGFGIPIIEANAIGRPVITSNITAMPETASNAALLVNPYNEEEIRSGLLNIQNNSALRSELIERGYHNCQRFKIENIKKQYLNLYKELAQNNI